MEVLARFGFTKFHRVDDVDAAIEHLRQKHVDLVIVPLDGIADLQLATGGALALVPGLFNVQGAFHLTVNTFAGDAFVQVAGARVNLMGLVLSGQLAIGVRGGEFFVHVPAANPLSLNFFGVASLSVSGSFNYDPATDTVGGGGFRFTASAGWY